MRIRTRIFIGFGLILLLTFYLFVSWIWGDVAIQPKKVMEESMLDLAHVIAAYLEGQIADGVLSTSTLEAVMRNVRHREFLARIYEMQKSRVSMTLYVTDGMGKVLYDSAHRQNVGRDFSQWIDVKRTLEGRYGARTTREIPIDPLSSVAYVAAPICDRGRIAGVCVVGKSWESINSFIVTTRRRIITIGVLSVLFMLGLSYAVSFWITRPLQRLNDYALAVRDGSRVSLPRLGRGEVGTLGRSFEQMRETLEGKTYVESTIQALTHQLKGPLSAIKSAAELLTEELPPIDRARFITNIQQESVRIQQIIDRLLELAAIEKRSGLENRESIDLPELLGEVLESFASAFYQKRINLEKRVSTTGPIRFSGERFLVRQALQNLLQNAVDFTPERGSIAVIVGQDDAAGVVWVRVADSGPGIPDYALGRVFEKFYSLQRPDSGRKGTGLGLPLVKEVAELHHGSIAIENGAAGGVEATLTLPVSPGG